MCFAHELQVIKAHAHTFSHHPYDVWNICMVWRSASIYNTQLLGLTWLYLYQPFIFPTLFDAQLQSICWNQARLRRQLQSIWKPEGVWIVNDGNTVWGIKLTEFYRSIIYYRLHLLNATYLLYDYSIFSTMTLTQHLYRHEHLHEGFKNMLRAPKWPNILSVRPSIRRSQIEPCWCRTSARNKLGRELRRKKKVK